MTSVMQIKSLSVLEGLEKNLRTLIEINKSISDITKPSDILDITGDLIRSLDEFDMSFSVICSDLNQLKVIYKETLIQFIDTHAEYLKRINERREKQIQLNSNVEFYNPDKLMKKFLYGKVVSEDMIPEIVDMEKPEEYSMLAIINKIEKEDPLVFDSLGAFMSNTKRSNDLLAKIPVVKSSILSLKSGFSSNEFIQTMSSEIYTTECKNQVYMIQDNIQAISGWIRKVRDYIKTIFQVFVALKDNYDVYAIAVDKFTSIALESLFNDKSYYEVL